MSADLASITAAIELEISKSNSLHHLTQEEHMLMLHLIEKRELPLSQFKPELPASTMEH